MSIGHPDIAAIFAGARGHFLGVDLEHTTMDLDAVQGIIRACHAHGRACLPRIFPGNLEQLRRLLDAGADGIVLPQIGAPEDIDRAAEALWYPPKGKRGFGVAAAHRFGRAFDAYVQGANAALTLIIQVETIDAVRRIEPLVAHPAVDGVMVGPYDLSGSLGIPGQLAHPKVAEACATVVAACRRAGKSCGLHVIHPTLEDIQRRFAEGYTFLLLGSDVFHLWRRTAEVDGMLEACEGLEL
jgi:2-dehydro-3-deoxyglucarate aldolase